MCNFDLAKYTCPKCEVKTCKLECARIHKKELNCDGIRDKTKYVPLRQITEADLMSDYVFLESCTNYASARRTDKTKRFTSRNRSLPIPLMRLKKAAADPERQITLNFLLPNFDKHKANTTHYDWSSKVICWCIEWRFINANNKIIIDERCNESQLMTELIAKYFDYSNSMSSLGCYRSEGLNNVALLLKAEGVRKSQNRFFSMDLTKTLKENLRGKVIIEYPVIHVIFNSQIQDYDVINEGKFVSRFEKLKHINIFLNFTLHKTDEEVVMEETRKHKNHYFPSLKRNQLQKPENKRKVPDANSDAVPYNSHKPVNFLFSNDNDFDDEGSSDET